ncbi:MAG: hypothetical protein IJ366_05310 [Clostridia bacterium]|nr:hypothetical protein [Clostridia bacterium]
MNMHKIVGLYTDMGYKHERLLKQAAAYKTEDNVRPNITIYLSDNFIEEKHKENPHLSLDECEYIWTGSLFYDALINFEGFILHASAVMMDGRAYLFSAPSGTGKSTHTSLWLKHFGDRAQILNDDKPAIRVTDNGIRAYGTPWSGKTDLNINTDAELAGICFLERDTTNHIEEISKAEAIVKVLNQTLRPSEEKQMGMLLDTLDVVISKIPIYKMGCTISEEAVEMAYNKMK